MNENNSANVPRVMMELDGRLAPVEREIVKTVRKLSLISGGQVRRLYYPGSGTGRNDAQPARRALLKLVRLGVLTRLDRRVGGIRGGSETFCYRLAPMGERLVRFWDGHSDGGGRTRPEPGERFIVHRLTVSDQYVKLLEAAREVGVDKLEVLAFDAEPAAWRDFIGLGGAPTVLKPDAFVRLGVGDVELEWFIEVDLGTNGSRARAAQAGVYRDYWRSGAAGEVMPRVLWLVPNQIVGARVHAAIRPEGRPYGLFVVDTFDHVVRAAMSPGPLGAGGRQ